MIRLFVILVFVVVIAVVAGVIALSRYLDRKQRERKEQAHRDQWGYVMCEVCGGSVITEGETLCWDHRTAMKEVNRWTAEEA